MMRRVRHANIFGLACLSLALAGCTGANSGDDTDPVPGPQANAPATMAQPAQTQPFAPAIDPATLVGMPSGAVQAKLGDPALLRRDGQAQVWQYRGPGCIVDLFLYRRGDGDAQVAFVDLRGPRVDLGQGPACMGAMIAPGEQAAALNRS